VFAEGTQEENTFRTSAYADGGRGTPDMTGPRRPQQRGPVAGSMLTSDPTRSAPDRRGRGRRFVPSPQAPRRNVVLDRRRLDREERGQ